jgi:hypothetical protein
MSEEQFSADLRADFGTAAAAQTALNSLNDKELPESCRCSIDGSILTIHVSGGSTAQLRENLNEGFALFSSVT